MLKIALYSSPAIYVIVNNMCVCLILGIWWSTYGTTGFDIIFVKRHVGFHVVRCGLTRGTLSGERVLALILLIIMIGSLLKMMSN
jgi:hypothetical protein